MLGHTRQSYDGRSVSGLRMLKAHRTFLTL